MFSRRTQWDLAPSPLAESLAELRRSGADILDLTASNPTTAGFDYDHAAIAAALSAAASQPYAPEPFGLPSARQAVADYYRDDHQLAVSPDRLILTASTSEAYSFAFRLLCDFGDEALIAQPSYPLFDYLAQLDDVALRPFSMFYDHGWHLDRTALQAAITPRSRAVVLVHPNNPTGHFTSAADRIWLDAFCAQHQLALIADEVFLDYPWAATPSADAQSFLATPATALTLVLSGLSKIAGLPQMKLAWIALHGPANLVNSARERLEIIADTFLSVSTPIQHALPELLDLRRSLGPQIRRRVAANLAALDHALAGQTLVTRLAAEAGWYAILRLPAHRSADDEALTLLTASQVHVHPGGYFGLPDQGYFAISLLPPKDAFNQALTGLLSHFRSLE
jgi:alanine-synthesizing transaminase